MSWDVIFFYLIAAVSIVTALGVVTARNPVHSAIFLVLCFVNIAGVFVMLGAEFLAVIQIIVYTGAILVLVLFVVMLVDPEDQRLPCGGRWLAASSWCTFGRPK